jgi:hypothetical protein
LADGTYLLAVVCANTSLRAGGLTSGYRFVSPSIAKKYNFEVPPYQGVDQVVEVGSSEQKL